MKRMNDDQLRAALSRRDPAAGRPAEAASGATRALWEQIMTVPVDERTSTTGTAVPARSRRRLTFALAAAALAVLAGVGTVVAVSSGTPDRTGQSASAQPMELRMPDASVASSCAMFDIAFLRAVPVAFQGTAVEVADTSVVLRVDRWFRGGQDGVTTVRVTRSGPEASDGSVDIAAGKTYLVAANDGSVLGCGYTGELTTEMLAYYDEAF
jgi:hypothetical protein